ncbi:CLUMA_CG011128, isoform A [Clunio marinus]|uniref:CLUMA_CG011128, isoform A n=1 Tax=Clunio marinus TaxID=568069 RepID=A0A1J1IDW6_9DIPT|nr:CLUMA_CG011128, isoform A [Clunio marinus]
MIPSGTSVTYVTPDFYRKQLHSIKWFILPCFFLSIFIAILLKLRTQISNSKSSSLTSIMLIPKERMGKVLKI